MLKNWLKIDLENRLEIGIKKSTRNRSWKIDQKSVSKNQLGIDLEKSTIKQSWKNNEKSFLKK